MRAGTGASTKVIVQSRLRLAAMLALALVFLAYLAAALGQADPEVPQGVAQVACLVFLGLALVCAASFLWPPKLVLTPEGLVHRAPWRRRAWRWAEVGPFAVEGLDEDPVIRFTERGGRRITLPPGWALGARQVAAELNAARERWR